MYNQAIFGQNKQQRVVKKTFKRVNANRPMEMSSKRPVPMGTVDVAKKNKPRDPRFDPKCGEYDSSKFKEQYEFVNDMRTSEVTELREKLNKTQDPKEVKRLKFVIQRMDNQIREEGKRKEKVTKQKEEEKAQSVVKAEGKKPFYKKQSQVKAEDLVKKYLELKSSGKLEKHLEKRRKKNTAKDRKKFSFD